MSVSTPAQVSAATGGGATATQTFNAAPGAGDMLVISLHWGNSAATAPTITGGTIGGWTLLGSVSGGQGAWGASAGPRGVTIYYKTADGTENGGTVSYTQAAGDGQSTLRSPPILSFPKTLSGWATPVMVSGTDTTSNTSYSATGGSNPGGAIGDRLLLSTSIASGTVTQSAPTLTWTGVTPVTLTLLSATFGASGNAVRAIEYHAGFTGGAGASTSPVHAMTLSGASAGSTAFVRLRDQITTQSGSGTTTATATTTGTAAVVRPASGTTTVTATADGAAEVYTPHSVLTDASDGSSTKSAATWATVYSGGSGYTIAYDRTSGQTPVGVGLSGGTYFHSDAFLQFDTRVSATPISATLNVRGQATTSGATVTLKAYHIDTWDADGFFHWDASVLSGYDSVTLAPTLGGSAANLSATIPVGWLNTAGSTAILITDARAEANTAPTTDDRATLTMSEGAGANRPELVLTVVDATWSAYSTPLTVTAAPAGAASVSLGGSGTTTATATIAGAATVTRAVDGTTTATATASGTAAVTQTVAGTLTVTAAPAGTAGLVANVASGATTATATLGGAAAVTRTVSGDLTVTAAPAGTAVPSHTVDGTLTVTAAPTGTAAVARTVAGTLSGTATIAGTAGLVVTVTSGTTTATATLTGAAAVTRTVSGTLTATAAPSGSAAVAVAVAGTTSAVATLTGALGPSALNATGTTTATATLAGAALAVVAVQGVVNTTATIVGDGAVLRAAQGTLTVTASLTGTTAATRPASGNASATASIAGDLGSVVEIGGVKNLIPNPSFEGSLAGWTFPSHQGTLDSSIAAYGSDSVKVTALSAAAGNALRAHIIDIPIVAGRAYTISGHYASVDGSVPTVNFSGYFTNAAGTTIQPAFSSNLSTTASFQRLSLANQVAPSGAVKMRIEFKNATAVASGASFNFDAAMLTESATLTPYFDTVYTPPMTATATLSGTAAVLRAATGTLTATAAPTGTSAVLRAAQGDLTASAAITGTPSAIHTVGGNSNIVAVIGGSSGASDVPATGNRDVTATLTGSASVTQAVSGTLTTTATLSGSAAATRSVSGTTTITTTRTGTAAVARAVQGSLTVTADPQGDTGSDGDIEGSIQITANVTGSASVARGVSGDLSVLASTTGSSAKTAAVSGNLGVTVIRDATTAVARAVSGDLTGTVLITSTGAGVKEAQGNLTVTASLSGTAVVGVVARDVDMYAEALVGWKAETERGSWAFLEPRTWDAVLEPNEVSEAEREWEAVP